MRGLDDEEENVREGSERERGSEKAGGGARGDEEEKNSR